jgi:hypothetical protein
VPQENTAPIPQPYQESLVKPYVTPEAGSLFLSKIAPVASDGYALFNFKALLLSKVAD